MDILTVLLGLWLMGFFDWADKQDVRDLRGFMQREHEGRPERPKQAVSNYHAPAPWQPRMDHHNQCRKAKIRRGK